MTGDDGKDGGSGGNRQTYDDAARRPFNPDGGEDESSVASDAGDGGVREDQKPLDGSSSADVDRDDPHKTEKLAQAGRSMDTDDGAD